MFSARFATIWAAANSSLGIVICFFDSLDLLAINLCLIPDSCCITAYATAHVPSKHLQTRGYLLDLKTLYFYLV